MFVIYLYLKHSAKPARWADSSRSHAYSQGYSLVFLPFRIQQSRLTDILKKFYRKTAKAQARNDDAVQRVRELGGSFDDEPEKHAKESQ